MGALQCGERPTDETSVLAACQVVVGEVNIGIVAHYTLTSVILRYSSDDVRVNRPTMTSQPQEVRVYVICKQPQIPIIKITYIVRCTG